MSGDSYEPSLNMFREAIARDPQLALGYIVLARAPPAGATVYGWSAHPDVPDREETESDEMAKAADLQSVLAAIDERNAEPTRAPTGQGRRRPRRRTARERPWHWRP
jgi:hypothetical protein